MTRINHKISPKRYWISHMKRINTPSIPTEITALVFETLHANLEKQASVKYSDNYVNSDYQKAKIGRDVAKNFVSLKQANSEFQQIANTVLNQHEHTELAATQNSIQHLAKQAKVTQVKKVYWIPFLSFLGQPDQPTFRQHMVRLLQAHKHIKVPFKTLDLLQSQIALEELRNAPSNHFDKLVLDFSSVPENTWNAHSDLAEKLNSTLIHISQNQPNCRIQLSLRNSYIPPTNLLTILANVSKTKVHQLDLSDNNLGSHPPLGEALAAATKSPFLTRLGLRFCKLTPQQIQSLTKALPKSRLSELDMSMNNIPYEAMRELSNNLPGTQLKTLKMMDCLIQDLDFAMLVKNLPKTQLEILDLGHNEIGDESSLEFAKALPKCKLTHLDLRINHIAVRGATAIATALPESNLSELDLSLNNLRDDGLMAFARNIPHFSKLKALNLADNNSLSRETRNAVTLANTNSSNALDLHI